MENTLSFNTQHPQKMLIPNNYTLCMVLLLYNRKDFKDKKLWSILDKKKIECVSYYKSRAEHDLCWKYS